MATRTPLTLHQGNAETVLVTVTPDTAGDDLTAITSLEFFLKLDACESDADATTVKLDTGDVLEAVILTQTADQITAEFYVPAAALAASYSRFYRVDGLVGAARRTAVYGPVTVVDL